MSNKHDICPPESARGLWYDPDINRFRDEAGEIQNDLQPYFATWQLDEWKKLKQYETIKDRFGDLWEIFYVRFRCHQHCLRCGRRCEIYDLVKEE